MDHHDLYVDKWFKLPPKEKDKKYIIEPSPKGKGKKHAKKLHENSKKKTGKKGG